MERLKAAASKHGIKSIVHLHSSMERLKVGKLVHEKLCVEFTFQYGEIKSFQNILKKSDALPFTFQYGEIKSRAYLYWRPLDVKIYIPVWRD